MIKHIFIVNPAAGKGKGLKLIPEIRKILTEKKQEYGIEITERPGHAQELARIHGGKGESRIYSVGGDGTLNEVLNGMVGMDSSLAVIPCGSGNDFIRSLTSRWSIEDIVERTIDGSEKSIDVIKVNERYFINIASVGFDAEVVYNARKIKKIPGLPGSVAYILGILSTVFKYGGSHMHINIDGNRIDKKLLLTAVANGRYYGGGMLPVPAARIEDGLIDICTVDAISKVKILAFFPKLIKGTHGDMKEVSFYKGKRVEIASNHDMTINTDGEVIRGQEIVFEVIPKGVRIIVPKDDKIS